jgi:hypothetical protein
LDGAIFDRLVLASCFGEELGGASGVCFGTGVDSDCHQAGEGGVADFFAGSDLFCVEAFVVVLGGEAHCRVVGLVRLEDDFAGSVGAACTAGDLGEQLESAFGCAEVWEREALISERNANQCDCGDVVSFGDHLCAHQHVDLAAAQPIENLFDAVARCRVAIEPSHAGLGETLFDGLLELFGSHPKAFLLSAPARGARHRNRPVEITVVTTKRALPPVLGQRDTARRALGHHAACRTAHTRRKTAPVEENDRLMAGFQTVADRRMEGPGN